MTPHYLSSTEIWELAEQRRSDARFGARQAMYNRQLAYYYGAQSMGQNKQVWAMNSIGKPMLRQIGGAMDIPRTFVANKTKSIVDDAQALIGRLPTIRTEIPDYSEAGIAKAELQTRYLYSTYELCRMELQQVQAGFYLADLGDACYTLEVDWDADHRVVVSSVDPQYCFPSWYRGRRKFELYDIVICYYEDEETLKREYDYSPPDGSDRYRLCVTYMSPYQRTVVIGEELFQPVDTVYWDLGFCPAVWMHNQITDGRLANADISQVLDLQDLYNFTLNVAADGMVQFTYPMIGIRDPIGVGEGGQIPYGPGSAIALGERGGIEVANMGANVRGLYDFQQRVGQDINQGSGTSQVRQEGMPDRSNISGRALHAAQGPESTRIDIKQVILGGAFTLLNANLFAMQEKAPLVGDHEFEIYGRWKGQSFRETFKPKADIDGWYRTTVSWDSLLGMSKAQRIQMASQAKAVRLYDDLTLMEMVGVDDPAKMREAIERDIKWEARVQAEAQAAAQKIMGSAQNEGQGAPPQGGQPASGGAAAGPTAAAAPVAPVMRPSHLPASQSLPTGGSPQGVTVQDLKDKLENAKLRGTVFAVGEMATMGRSLRPQLVISDHRDYQKVNAALADVAGVKVVYKSEADMPDLKLRVA